MMRGEILGSQKVLNILNNRGVHGPIWVGFSQTQNPNHIGYSGLSEVKQPPVIQLGGFGQTR